MQNGVGADIKAGCNKCKLNTWHVILAKVDGRIAKVQCKSCNAQHRYKSPDGKTVGARSATSRKKPAADPLPAGPTVQPDLSKPIRPYSPREHYAVSERVDHSKFGIGVIELISTPGKMTVCFADRRRILAVAKKGGGLVRPENRTFDT